MDQMDNILGRAATASVLLRAAGHGTLETRRS